MFFVLLAKLFEACAVGGQLCFVDEHDRDAPANRISQAADLAERLADDGPPLPVFVGMRNWHPYLADVLVEMADAGVRHAIGLIAAPHHCYSSCTQYKENVRDARQELVRRGWPDIAVTYVDSWYDHPGFIEANTRHVTHALEQLDPDLRDPARLLFTAHSIPIPMANACRYVEQITTSAKLIAERLGRDDWALVYQSRSGRPQDPWLEPDVCDYLRKENSKGLRSVVVVPVGFVCDHLEVLFDLDTEVADLCRELDLPMVRSETVNDDPVFVNALADLVRQTCRRYRHAIPLPIVAPEHADRER